jgi:hypothetical protein
MVVSVNRESSAFQDKKSVVDEVSSMRRSLDLQTVRAFRRGTSAPLMISPSRESGVFGLFALSCFPGLTSKTLKPCYVPLLISTSHGTSPYDMIRAISLAVHSATLGYPLRRQAEPPYICGLTQKCTSLHTHPRGVSATWSTGMILLSSLMTSVRILIISSARCRQNGHYSRFSQA